jgi:beta-lactam-binding protein with PASTA domain
VGWPIDHRRADWHPRPGLVVGSALAVSVATVTALWFTVGDAPLAMGGTSVVPPLVGMSLAEARRGAADRGLVVVVTGTVTDPIVVRGGVAAQQPLAGATLSPGQTIEVILSDGPECEISSVRSEPLETPPTKATAPSPPSPPKKKAAPASPVAKRPSSTVVVPRLLGRSLAAARERLRRDGLRPGQISEAVDEDRGDRTVLRQSPAPGQRVAPGTAVEITVNNTSNL